MAYQDYQLIRITVDRGICWATIDHPPINLLDVSLICEISRLTEDIEADGGVRVLVVDSADPEFFIAHAGVELILGPPTDDTGLHDELSPFHALMERFRTLPQATIAVIEGIARGGGSEFAMAFDMRYAALGKARLGQPEVAVKIIPGGGGTQRLPRLVGRGRALEVILGCMDIDAATAEAWGYLDRALPPDELRRFVDTLATRIAASPIEAISRAKRAVDAAIEDPTTGLGRRSAVPGRPRTAGGPPAASGHPRRGRADPRVRDGRAPALVMGGADGAGSPVLTQVFSAATAACNT